MATIERTIPCERGGNLPPPQPTLIQRIQRTAVSPIIVLRREGWRGFVYTLSLIAIGVILCSIAHSHLHTHYFEWAIDSEVPVTAIFALSSLLYLLCFVPLLPISFVAILLPVRQVWVHGNAPVSRLLAETFPSLYRASQTIGHIAKPFFYTFAPLLILVCIVVFLEESEIHSPLIEAARWAIIPAAIFGLWRGSLLLAAIPIALLTGTVPAQSVAHARIILQQVRIPTFLLASAVMTIPFGAATILRHLTHLEPIELVGIAFLTGFIEVLSVLAMGVLCIRSTIAFHRALAQQNEAHGR